MLKSVTVAAPAQIANIFGLFDKSGVCLQAPPLNNRSTVGGVGDIISVHRGKEGTSISVEYHSRVCDESGEWTEETAFGQLAKRVKEYPKYNIIEIVIQNTLEKIASLNEEMVRYELNVEVVKCLPFGKVGIGLGSSACSTAVARAVDELYGGVIQRHDKKLAKNHGRQHEEMLELMLSGEVAVSGGRFYDNVAPLLFGGLVFVGQTSGNVKIESLKWPEDISLATITPDLTLSTADMRDVLQGKKVGLQYAIGEINRKVEVIRGLQSGDSVRVIENAFENIVETFRWSHIPCGQAILEHARKRVDEKHCVTIGIAGSGPTIYCAADSDGVVEQTSEEIRKIWMNNGINSVRILHKICEEGISVIEKY